MSVLLIHTWGEEKTTAIKHKENTQALLFGRGMEGENTEERREMRENVQEGILSPDKV